MNNQEPHVGVYICHCGQNIAGKVDVQDVARFAKNLEHVALARHYQFMCSDQGQEMIISDVVNNGLNRVVVASCSPRMHLPTFARACSRAGLNPYMLQMSNIREGSAWVSLDGKQATRKARALVAAAVSRVQKHRPLTTRKIGVNKSLLVIGGGIAGMQAALTAAESGFPVTLVEKEASIGGQMAKLDKTFPTLDCAACIGTPKMVEVAQNPDINLLTHSEVKEINGFVGNYTVTILKKPRYVLHERCTGCGECAGVCPVTVPSEWNEGLGSRTAIYRSFPQAVPGTFCIDKKDRAPCTGACPAGVNIQGYVQLIGQGKYREALELIRERLPLPGVLGRVCPHPCESNCRRTDVDSAVSIRALKRFAADNASVDPAAPEVERPEKVAVIGSGPAGLAAACFLRRQGFQITIYESAEHLGGMMRTGIPDFRLPPDVLDAEIELILKTGIEARTSQSFGQDFTLDSLRSENFSAVFLAIGAQGGTGLGLKDEGCSGVMDAVGFLREANLGRRPDVGGRVVVVGGGNVAMDAARMALRLGAREVTVVYRRSEEEMPAHAEEIEAARQEGVKFSHLTQPCRYILENGCVTGLECLSTSLGSPDASGRRRPEPVADSEHVYHADTIITAVGQRILAPWASAVPELEWTPKGTIWVDEQTLQTSIPWIFAAGDAVSGPATVVQAVAGARRAAEAISRYLDKKEPALDMQPENPRPEKNWNPLPKDVKPLQRALPGQLEPQIATQGFQEVEKTLDVEAAQLEAGRCLNCAVCSECMQCVNACEREAIDHGMQAEEIQVDVGGIILATGYELYNPEPLTQYGYGLLDEVYTSLQFERLNNATGPTQGQILTRDGRTPEKVGIIHCVGSRDKNHKDYCSRVCCMYSLKFAHLIRERTGAEVYSFYIDMRTPGKNYEEFYNRIQAEGVHLIRGRVAQVTDVPDNPEDAGRLLVVAENTLSGKVLRIPVDMVILSPAMIPAAGSTETARLAGVSTDSHGWLTELHPKLAPVSTQSSGVFVAGCCQGPKDIPDTVAQASAAAGEAVALLSKGWVSTLAERAVIDQDICSGCGICTQVCPYGAASILPEKRTALINEALCRGCGSCSASCPSKASTVQQFSSRQIFSEISGLLKAAGS